MKFWIFLVKKNVDFFSAKKTQIKNFIFESKSQRQNFDRFKFLEISLHIL